ncbi:hypothetical protein [Marasmitruncus massiliensis]|uniref:hypothetical protein n=1 Tax=Marasmitruncus massiliensis TaxID=1944642 RepID=UPI000C7C1063|nr:hypothetical protein [Marasmitruncus massiliensis]
MAIQNILISPKVEIALPGVLIDYLCKLAMSGEYSKQAIQTFLLAPGKLGGRSIQKILYVDKPHRVFGFEPVRCNLIVLNSGNNNQMILTD